MSSVRAAFFDYLDLFTRMNRYLLMDWIDRGFIRSENIERALRVGSFHPSALQWRWFIDRLLLGLGALALAAGVVFFFAYNWNELGQLEKFAIVEALLLIALGALWKTGMEAVAGKAVLFVATVLVGTLLALVGQTYQTGADTFELFGLWAALVLPWVLLGRFAALWLFWLLLVNLAVVLYLDAFGGIFRLLGARQETLWALFAINAVALAAWEIVELRPDSERWPLRLLATVVGGTVTALALTSIFALRNEGPFGAFCWFAWAAVTHYIYRNVRLDVYMLAGLVLSAIVVFAAGLVSVVSDDQNLPISFLMVALATIGISTFGGWWLKKVVEETHR